MSLGVALRVTRAIPHVGGEEKPMSKSSWEKIGRLDLGSFGSGTGNRTPVPWLRNATGDVGDVGLIRFP